MKAKTLLLMFLSISLFSCSFFMRETPPECEEIEDNLWKIYADGIGGDNVTIDGNIAITGTRNYVDIFEYDNTGWSNTSRISFENIDDEIIDISLHQDNLIIGNVRNDSTRVVYVYNHNGNWEKVTEIYSQYESDEFGRSVDICENNLVISSGFGGVIIYKKINEEWIFDSELNFHTDSTTDNRWNDSHIAISGNFIISSKNQEVIISSRIDSTWQFMQKLEQPNTMNTQFGYSLDIDSTQVIIGDIQTGEFDGVAYIFELDGENWVESRILSPIPGSNGMCFGNSVGIYKNSMVVGTYNTEIYKYYGYTHLFPSSTITGASNEYFSLERNGGNDVAISKDFAIFSGTNCAYIYKYR